MLTECHSGSANTICTWRMPCLRSATSGFSTWPWADQDCRAVNQAFDSTEYWWGRAPETVKERPIVAKHLRTFATGICCWQSVACKYRQWHWSCKQWPLSRTVGPHPDAHRHTVPLAFWLQSRIPGRSGLAAAGIQHSCRLCCKLRITQGPKCWQPYGRFVC